MKSKLLILLTAIFIAQLYLASALTISSVTSNPSEVQPGEKFSLDLTIKNNLNQDAENVIVSLNLNQQQIPFAPYQSSNEKKIDSIIEDDKEKVGFNLIAFSDAVSGIYNIPVQITYNNGTSENFLVSVIINAKPKIDISSEGPVLIRGTNGKITIKIVNSGLGNSKFLSLSLSQVSGTQIIGPNNVYIGNIDSNDFDTADFNVFVNANAPSLISLPVELIYTDSRNNQITENKIVLIKTYTAKEALGLGLMPKNNAPVIIISVIGVLILFLIYRRIRKRNRNKRNGQ